MPRLTDHLKNQEQQKGADAPLKRFRKIFINLSAPETSPPTIPEAITLLSNEKLGDLQSRYTAWREYTEDLLQDALVEFTAKNEEYTYKRGQELLLVSGKNNDEREAKIQQNDEIRKLSISLSDAEMYHTLLLKKLESFTNCLMVISREISRRSSLEYHKT